MIENVLIAKELYKGWTVRVHYNDTVPTKIIDWLKLQDNVILVHHENMKTKASNMFWRFEDLFIKNATVIVRDSDSRLSEREFGFVNEWLQSSKDFHIIRDHKDHTTPILAGTMGCRNNCLDYLGIPNGSRNVNACPMSFEKGLQFMKRFLVSVPPEMDKYNIDQIFLAQYVYNFVIGNAYVNCVHIPYEPFAKVSESKDKGFVGEIITECPNASTIMGDAEITFERVQHL